jgi:hypothetical protein
MVFMAFMVEKAKKNIRSFMSNRSVSNCGPFKLPSPNKLA